MGFGFYGVYCMKNYVMGKKISIDNIRIPRRPWDELPLSINARLMRGKVKGTCSVYVVISSILRENAEASLLCLQLYQQRGKEKGPNQIPRSCKCYFSLFSIK